MIKNNNALKASLLAGFSFAGYNIGSGFATGLEAQQFFAVWGNPRAFAGLLTAMLTTAAVFVPVYITGCEKKTDAAYNIYHHYCGRTFGKVIDAYMYFSILLIILTLMSGAGATIRQYFGLPNMAGAVLLGILCVAAALLGLKKLMRVLSYAGVLIIVFVVCCTVWLRVAEGITVTVGTEELEGYLSSGAIRSVDLFGFSSPVIGGLASAGLLIISSLPWVASTGALCENKGSAILSGVFSVVFFYAAQAVVVYLNLMCMDCIAGNEVPVLAVFQKYLPALAMVYSVIIILAIFSTVTGRLFLFSSRFDKGRKKARVIISSVIVAAAAFGGAYLPFSALSDFMFTLNGCLGVVIGSVIILRTAVQKFHKKKPA